jgi:hypothetical protein
VPCTYNGAHEIYLISKLEHFYSKGGILINVHINNPGTCERNQHCSKKTRTGVNDMSTEFKKEGLIINYSGSQGCSWLESSM